MAEQELSNVDVVVYAVFKLGGHERKVHTEEVAYEAYQLAKERFGWRLPKFRKKGFPNKEPVRFRLQRIQCASGDRKGLRIFAKCPDVVAGEIGVKVMSDDQDKVAVRGKCVMMPVGGSNFAEGTVTIEGRTLKAKAIITVKVWVKRLHMVPPDAFMFHERRSLLRRSRVKRTLRTLLISHEIVSPISFVEIYLIGCRHSDPQNPELCKAAFPVSLLVTPLPIQR